MSPYGEMRDLIGDYRKDGFFALDLAMAARSMLKFLEGYRMFELQVEGMSCGHCINAVTKSVREVDGGAKVEVDLAARKVKVESTAALDRIKKAIEDAGYDVRSAA